MRQFMEKSSCISNWQKIRVKSRTIMVIFHLCAVDPHNACLSIQISIYFALAVKQSHIWI